MGIKVTGLQHANIRLQTKEQAEDFYGRILGLERDPGMPWNDERRLRACQPHCRVSTIASRGSGVAARE